MWRVYKEANRPWPVLSEDSVIDYMVMEAVFLKDNKEQKDAEKKAKRAEWKRDTSKLDKYR